MNRDGSSWIVCANWVDGKASTGDKIWDDILFLVPMEEQTRPEIDDD